jgi:DNA topoisomerase II
MINKKEEHDTLEKLGEKDLWCQDLDAFVAEWELQLKEEADYQKSIRNTNRRASRKIGAGKNVASRGRPKQDDEYNPKPLKANPNKGMVKVEQKPHQRFLSMFENKPKPKSKTNSMGSDGADEAEASGISDGDFDMLRADKDKPVANVKGGSRAPSEQPANGRVKRAAAAAPKKWVIEDDDSESDGGGEFDIGDMVKGIGGADLIDTTAQNGRLSLFAMSRPGSSHGRATSTDLPKLKSKPSKIFNFSDDDAADETNYEMLAKSSPHKTAAAPKDTLDSYLSDSDDLVPITKKVPVKAAAPAAKAISKPGRPKKAPVPKKAAEPAQAKPVTLSPAAKAYAAKQNKMKLPAKKNVISDDEDEDIDMEDANSPAPKPAAPRGRGRPPRAAAVAKPKKPIYIDSDDDELDVDDQDESALVEDEPSEDDFDDSD